MNAGSGTALRVLVVDDSDELRQRVRPLLERAGLAVVGEAADGAQAVAQATTHQPDVVLMDVRMPRMDGIQATRLLRRQQPETPVVLWTGDDDARLASAVHESGARAGVAKGIGTVELVATLRGVCDAQDPTRPYDAGRHGGVGPGPVEAAPSAHSGASLAGNPERPSAGAAHADPPTLQPHGRAEPPPGGLAAAERVALERLGAADGFATRWPVGRQVARSLVNRQLVVVASDYVLLTEAGRRVLASDSQRRSRPAPPDPGRVGRGGPARSAPG